MKRFNSGDLFKEKATAVHGDVYDYSKVNYTKSQTKVDIICPVHGVFQQRPNGHLSGKGCPKCSKLSTRQKLSHTSDTFEKKSRLVHGDKYEYDGVNYVNNRTPVAITCKLHGVFHQKPHNHLNGKGCRKCGTSLSKQKQSSNNDIFISKSHQKHAHRYDYSKVRYMNNHSKVVITCPKHGDFEQTPVNHLNGKGCPRCKAELTASRCRYTTDLFIEKATAVHGDVYDYSKVNYVDSKTKVTIICSKHGAFEQAPDKHLSGQGCPVCVSSKGETVIKAILRRHNIEHIQQYKIPLQNNNFRYDFFLPDYNLLIEFHGGQHYFPVNFFGGEDGFNRTKLRDKIKVSVAKNLKYKMLVIPYTLLENHSVEKFESLLLETLTKKARIQPRISMPVKEKWDDVKLI